LGSDHKWHQCGNQTRHTPSHFLGFQSWFSLISTLARALFSIEDAQRKTIMQRDRASLRVFRSHVFVPVPAKRHSNGKRRTRATALNGHPSHADRPLPSSPLPQFPATHVIKLQVFWGDSVCAWPVDTCRDCARGGVASAILLCFDSSRRCRVQYINQVALAKPV
jgi:hypothetical protein